MEQVVAALVIGLVICYFYDRTRNLWGAVLTHNLIDLLTVLLPLATLALTGHFILHL